MIYIGSIRNSWNHIKISQTVVFSSMDKVLEKLIAAFTTANLNVTVSLSYYYNYHFYSIHELEMDSDKRPKKVNMKRIEEELKARPELYAKVLLT